MPHPFGRPLSKLRVVVRTANPMLARDVETLLSGLDVRPTWTPEPDAALEQRADLVLWDPALGEGREASVERIRLDLPLRPEALLDLVRAAWRIACLREEAAHYKSSWQESQREKTTSELQIERTERVLLASYRDLQAFNAELSRKNAELTQALERAATAQGLAEERKKVLMQVVHDLRSDLFNIALATDLAKKRLGSQRPFETINRSIDRIEEFLTEKTQRIQENRSPARCFLKAAMAEALSVVSPQIALKAQRLDLRAADHDGALPLSTIEFVQIAVNLLGNASKFSPAETTIRCEIRLLEDTLSLKVEDEGPGLPAPLIADPTDGKRADPSMPGSGLGLQNVRAILESISGSLHWQNGASGAVFEARIPLAGPRFANESRPSRDAQERGFVVDEET